jgi:hypothetical protein
MGHQSRLLAFFLLPLLPGADDEKAWITYSPPDRTFSVLLPEKPDETEVTIPEGPGRALSASFGEGGPVCIVVYNNIKGSLRTRQRADQFLRGLEVGMAKNGARPTEPSKDIKLGPVPGREIVGKGFQDRFFRARVYAVESRAYQLIVISADADARDSKEARKFFGSFQLLNLPVEPFHDGDREHDIAYQMGKVFGYVLVVGLIVYIVKKVRTKRNALEA